MNLPGSPLAAAVQAAQNKFVQIPVNPNTPGPLLTLPGPPPCRMGAHPLSFEVAKQTVGSQVCQVYSCLHKLLCLSIEYLLMGLHAVFFYNAFLVQGIK